MGSWNETCAFSRLAIIPNEPIRFLPIVQNTWRLERLTGHADKPVPVVTKGGSGVYITDLWTPFCLPLRGRYNDYGSIEEVPGITPRDKAEIAQFVKRVQRDAVPLKVGENSVHDVPTDDLKDLDTILEAMHEGRLYTKRAVHWGGHSPLVPISWMMVKELVWQTLLGVDLMNTDASFRWKGKSAKPKPTVSWLKAHYLSQLKLSQSEDRLAAIRSEMGWYRGVFDNSSFESPLRDHRPEGMPDPRLLVTAAAELDYIHMIAGDLRLTFHPTCGSGSQTHNLDLWSKVSRQWMKDDRARDRKWRDG